MAFSHGDAALDLNAVLIVNDEVQDAFGDGTAFVFGPVTVNAIIPVSYTHLDAYKRKERSVLVLCEVPVGGPPGQGAFIWTY